MREVMGIVCGAMFGEERVDNSVDLLSRVLVAFSVLPTFAATYCYRCLNVIEPVVMHSSLAFFLRRIQHFVGSVRIAGLCFHCGLWGLICQDWVHVVYTRGLVKGSIL